MTTSKLTSFYRQTGSRVRRIVAARTATLRGGVME